MKTIDPSRLHKLKTLRAYELATSKMAVPTIATRKEKNMNSKKKTAYKKTPEVKVKATWRCIKPGLWCKAEWYGKKRWARYQATAEKIF